MIHFEAWPKIPRLNREIVITEKIDGTNACIIIEEAQDATDERWNEGSLCDLTDTSTGIKYVVGAQSRNRLLSIGSDNAGFARWVLEASPNLIPLLGVGRHYGEWWGKGIQRGYGQQTKCFSLFNVKRWGGMDANVNGVPLTCVPVVARFTTPDTTKIQYVIDMLRYDGSQAAPGFMQPEGIVVYHTASNQSFKVLCEGDDISKTEAGVS